MGHLEVFEEVMPIFLALSTGPTEVTYDHVDLIELFTILLYNRTSSKVNIDEAHQELFTMNGRAMDTILQPEQPFCSISKGLCTKVGIVGAKCYKLQLACHPLGTGDGLTHKTGDLCGPST